MAKLRKAHRPEWCSAICEAIITWVELHPLTIMYLASVITSVAIVEGLAR